MKNARLTIPLTQITISTILPFRFQLTEEGRAMAKLLQSNASGESTETYSSSKDRSASSNPEPEIESPANSPPKSKPKPKVATRPTATSVRDYNLVQKIL